ncbi:MAG: Pvc16 family protein [Anaerotruncus massiliensis (ex Togo et al. 2019)]
MSAGLLKALRKGLCPEPVQSPESIQLASPADKNAISSSGFSSTTSGRWANTAPAPRWSGRATGGVPQTADLCYLLFLNGKAQIAAGAEAEQRILGRALQALADDPAVGLARLHSFEGEADEDAAITFLNLSFDDKSKIWSSLSVPYQLGVYFSVSPVLLSSTRSESFVRVRESEVTLSQREASAGRGGTP